jgi:hypothetical protein
LGEDDGDAAAGGVAGGVLLPDAGGAATAGEEALRGGGEALRLTIAGRGGHVRYRCEFAAGDAEFGRAESEVAYGEARSVQRQMETLQRSVEIQHDAVMKTLDAFRVEMRSEFAALRANNQVEVFRQMLPLSERVVALESRLQ